VTPNGQRRKGMVFFDHLLTWIARTAIIGLRFTIDGFYLCGCLRRVKIKRSASCHFKQIYKI
jgi:hypothetical protein